MVYEGTVRIGQEIPAKSWRISLAAINRWSGIIVVYDWAVPIIFSGFFLCVAGIAIMGLFDPREIWARKKMQESGPVVEILGWESFRQKGFDLRIRGKEDIDRHIGKKGDDPFIRAAGAQPAFIAFPAADLGKMPGKKGVHARPESQVIGKFEMYQRMLWVKQIRSYPTVIPG